MKELAKRKDFWSLGEMSVDGDYYTMYYKDDYNKNIDGRQVKIQDRATVFIRPIANKTQIDVNTESYLPGNPEPYINDKKSAELKDIIINFIHYINKRETKDYVSFSGELTDDKIDENLNYKNYLVLSITDKKSLDIKQIILLLNDTIKKPEFNKTVTVSGILENKELYKTDPSKFFKSKPVMFLKKWQYP